tara:strand:- start:848 stop:2359 length:1512 start_codon:yes stop_codon:yes gene_type:complete
MKTQEGKTWVHYQGEYFALYPSANGHQVDSSRVTAKHAYQAGRALGTLHLDLSKQSGEGFPSIDLKWNKQQWLARIDEIILCLQAKPTLAEIDAHALKRVMAQRSYLALWETEHSYRPVTQRQLIHGDYHLLNVFFHNDGTISGVIDWDLVQNMPRGYELARACQYMFQMDVKLSVNFLRGYDELFPLSKCELQDGAKAWSLFSDHHIWPYEEAYFKGNKAAKKFIPSMDFSPYLTFWEPIQSEFLKAKHHSYKGLTSHGYIDNPYSVEHVQPEFTAVVEQMLRRLEETFPGQLHSVYLYGSVPRGNAVFGQSDLDASVVFHQPLSSNDHKQLQRIANELTSQYSAISKLDFDPGHLREVLAVEEEYRWQFWLKHCCCCLWGEDLSTGFRLHKPSLRIAWQLNEDLPQVLESIQTQDGKAYTKVLGKKLLRSAYLLVAEQDNSWLSDLDSIAKVLHQYYPDDVTSIELCLRLAQGECGNVHRINELISGFGYKVVKQIEKAKA